MAEHIDYEIQQDWDIDFTEWGDLQVAYDNQVLLQNFVLLAARRLHPYVGENFTPEDKQRVKNRLEASYEAREYVDGCTVYEMELSGDELSLTVLINSDEYDWRGTITV